MHLFNSSGLWIAVKIEQYLYDVNSNWVGWFPWDDEHAVGRTGNYIGTIYSPNRFYKLGYFPYRGYPGYPGYPGYL